MKNWKRNLSKRQKKRITLKRKKVPDSHFSHSVRKKKKKKKMKRKMNPIYFLKLKKKSKKLQKRKNQDFSVSQEIMMTTLQKKRKKMSLKKCLSLQ